MLTGVFASLAVNAAGEAGGWTQLGRQAVLGVVGIAYPFVMTWIILWVTDRTVGLRVSPGGEEAVHATPIGQSGAGRAGPDLLASGPAAAAQNHPASSRRSPVQP